jgi:hypothetical protein
MTAVPEGWACSAVSVPPSSRARYSQSTDNVPAPVGDVRVLPALFTANAGDITSATVTFPGGISSRNLSQSGTAWELPSSDFYSSLAAADAAYPNGAYTFQTSGGTIGSTTGQVDLQGTYPTEPVFTGTSLTDLATMDVSQPITVTFNGFTPDPSSNDANFDIVLVGPGGFQFFEPSLTDTSFTFPANTFQPDSFYTVNLEYFNDNLDSSSNESDYSSFTQAQVTTAAAVPEPAGAALLALSAATLAWRRRRMA